MIANHRGIRAALDTEALSRFESEGGRLAPTSTVAPGRIPAGFGLLLCVLASAARFSAGRDAGRRDYGNAGWSR